MQGHRAPGVLGIHASARREQSLFTLPAAGIVRLRVYDCSGRLLRELADGEQPAGAQVMRWDGADARGRLAGAGMYLVCLDTPAGSLRRKLVRMRERGVDRAERGRMSGARTRSGS